MVVGLIMKCWICEKEMINTVGGCHCPTCGVSYNDGVFRTVTPIEGEHTPQSLRKQEGWICPVCGRGVAPWMERCPCQGNWEITYGTAISLNNDGNSQSTVTNINSEWNNYKTYTEG